MSTEDSDLRIQESLRAHAEAIDVPEQLASDTLERTRREQPSSSWRTRLQARRDARTAGASPARSPVRWVAVGAAAAVTTVALAIVGGAGSIAPVYDTAAPAPAGPDVVAGQSFSGRAEFSADMAPAPDVAGAPDALGQPAGTPGARVVRTADVQVRVASGGFEEAWRRANAVAGRHGGFVTHSEAGTVDERLAQGTLTMRVPAEHLDAAVSELSELGTLIRQSTTATDVSERLVDMDARLRSLRVQEDQYLELMRQADSVSEVLEVRGRLDAVREQIETLQAQRDNLQSQVDLSTLHVSIHEPGAGPAPGRPGPLADALARAIEVALAVVAGMIVVAAAVAPIAALAVVVWLVVRLVRARTV